MLITSAPGEVSQLGRMAKVFRKTRRQKFIPVTSAMPLLQIHSRKIRT